jgi:hypothetical protein
MNVEEIEEWTKSVPFVPFRLSLTNGRVFDIHDSSEIWPGKTNVLIIVPDPDKPDRYKTHATIGLLHVASIEPLHAVPQGKG